MIQGFQRKFESLYFIKLLPDIYWKNIAGVFTLQQGMIHEVIKP